ncbi:MAG TPA: hypothetical protein VEI02_13065 [Planctomycetota bacterium]|nr:hypothetical protein [Planctomycetota bacterium]
MVGFGVRARSATRRWCVVAAAAIAGCDGGAKGAARTPPSAAAAAPWALGPLRDADEIRLVTLKPDLVRYEPVHLSGPGVDVRIMGRPVERRSAPLGPEVKEALLAALASAPPRFGARPIADLDPAFFLTVAAGELLEVVIVAKDGRAARFWRGSSQVVDVRPAEGPALTRLLELLAQIQRDGG